MLSVLKKGKEVKVDYVEVVDPVFLGPVDEVKKGDIVAVAAVVGNTRLIDNIIIDSAPIEDKL